jgi:hypothetical protein
VSAALQIELPLAQPEPSAATPAAQMVLDCLTACLPPGVSLSFRRIVRARFEGSGRRKRSVADVEMFDGRHATVEVWQYAPGAWAHRWPTMDGGAAYWDGSAWRRDEAPPTPAAGSPAHPKEEKE